VGLLFVQDPGTGKILLGCLARDGPEAEHDHSYNAKKHFRVFHRMFPSWQKIEQSWLPAPREYPHILPPDIKQHKTQDRRIISRGLISTEPKLPGRHPSLLLGIDGEVSAGV
jgi:hypothetical protein